MMRHSWDNYLSLAWGSNEVRPVSMTGHSASVFGSSPMGATIVDSMDTLYIMGFNKEYEKGRKWIEHNLDVNEMVGLILVHKLIINSLD